MVMLLSGQPGRAAEADAALIDGHMSAIVTRQGQVLPRRPTRP